MRERERERGREGERERERERDREREREGGRETFFFGPLQTRQAGVWFTIATADIS